MSDAYFEADVRRWASMMSPFCVVLALILPVASLWRWLAMDTAVIAQSLGVRVVLVDGLERAIGSAIVLAPPLANAIGLLHLRSAFVRFAAGEVFSIGAARALRNFSAAVLAACILAILAFPALGLLTTYRLAGGPQIGISIGGTTLTLLTMAGATWVFAHVLVQSTRSHMNALDAGRRLSEENAQFV